MQVNNRPQATTTFLEIFVNEISPKLKKIDLLVKTAEDSIPLSDAADVLEISVLEVKQIMKSKKIAVIDNKSFFTIMENGSSEICTLYAREKKCGSPFLYSREHIAYIYDLDSDTVHHVCDDLNIKEVTSYTLPLLFSHLPPKKRG